MDRRERSANPATVLPAILQGFQTTVWTALPGIIQSFDPEKKTCTVQPALKANLQKEDGTYVWVTMPLLVDCPVQFPGGGGVTLTFPLKKDDECLVVFASRCIDAWWQSGGIQVQAEFRMHDLSDGFVIAGVSSVPNVPAGISTDRAQLRSVDGDAAISLDPATHDVEVNTSGDVTLTGANVRINGTLIINGEAYMAHEHRDVQTGSGNTGGVV